MWRHGMSGGVEMCQECHQMSTGVRRCQKVSGGTRLDHNVKWCQILTQTTEIFKFILHSYSL